MYDTFHVFTYNGALVKYSVKNVELNTISHPRIFYVSVYVGFTLFYVIALSRLISTRLLLRITRRFDRAVAGFETE